MAEQQKLRLDLQVSPPQKSGENYVFNVAVIALRKTRAVENVHVEILCDGVSQGQIVTDENGGAATDIGVTVNKESCLVLARTIGEEVVIAYKILNFPKKEVKKESGPAKLIVNPRRIENRILFHIKVLDEKNRAVPNVKILIIDTSIQNIPDAQTAENGECAHNTNLMPGEECEIMISVIGYGKIFRRTFYGRNGVANTTTGETEEN